jgi:hypothetical protein
VLARAAVTVGNDTDECLTREPEDNRLANKHGVRLRQSCLRIAKHAAMMAGRYAHAKQFNRHRRELRILRTRYRGHDAQNPRRVFISGQKRGVFGAIKCELRRRSAIEPVIGHLKAEGHLGRCYLKGRAGDAANAILSAIGHNFRRILAWLRLLLRLILIAILRVFIIRSALNPAY